MGSPNQSRQWAVRVPTKYIEFVEWDGLYHEILNEPQKDQVLVRVNDWLSEHLKGK